MFVSLRFPCYRCEQGVRRHGTDDSAVSPVRHAYGRPGLHQLPWGRHARVSDGIPSAFFKYCAAPSIRRLTAKKTTSPFSFFLLFMSERNTYNTSDVKTSHNFCRASTAHGVGHSQSEYPLLYRVPVSRKQKGLQTAIRSLARLRLCDTQYLINLFCFIFAFFNFFNFPGH